ncbi:MAG: hypothetical protein H0T92_21725 [Pyrinomonadaceae bacterium]|nr:hypothetical protein [Pyrinomonadaceae bacterium]
MESTCDDIGRLVAQPKPPGTVMQFHYAVQPDPGIAIAKHLKTRSYERVYGPACRLHDSNVDFYTDLANGRVFRTENASLNVTVPVTMTGDQTNKGVGAFIPALAQELRKYGPRESFRALAQASARTKDDGVVRRLLNAEQKAYAKAVKIFRQVQANSPVTLTRLNRPQLWGAVYRSHCINSRNTPKLSPQMGLDVRDLLCAQSIEPGGWYMLHGDTPVTVVSMMRPGDAMFADSMRVLTAHPELTFKHTLVAEFVYLDQRRAIRRLDKRIRQVKRTNNRADGRKNMTPEAEASLNDVLAVRRHVAGTPEALVEMRFYVVLYGDAARTVSELKASLAALEENCEKVMAAMQSIDGVEAAIEEPAALRYLYPQTMLGEVRAKPNGREFMEVANSLVGAIPVESSYPGSERPHSIYSTKYGRLVGVDLFDGSIINNPLILVLGQPKAGKSTMLARIINDVLASKPDAVVKAVDIGGSLAPHARSVGARYFRFDINDPKGFNIFYYPELKDGGMATDEDLNLMVLDALLLASVKEGDDSAPDILLKAIREVITNYAKRNGPGKPLREPTLFHLRHMLSNYDYGSPQLRERAASLGLALEKYMKNPWLDAPMHEDFLQVSPYEVYELDSLDVFQPDVRMALAQRVASRVIRTIGKLRLDGTRTPTVLVFDEVWKLRDNYPVIMKVIQKGARTGRKANVVTMLATHSYNDFEGIHDITKTAGAKLIGKQTGDYSQLVKDSNLSPSAVAAINNIRNVDGEFTQWLLVAGSGADMVVETLQCDLSPGELWTFTTNPSERDARARVSYLKPEWDGSQVVTWLAAEYPRGLVSCGLIEIEESKLLAVAN